MLANCIYFGDNLPILESLPSESVDLIYIDPPFNTGKVQARTQMKTVRSEQGEGRRRTAPCRPSPQPAGFPSDPEGAAGLLRLVCSVAEGLALGVLALAQVGGLGFLGLEDDRPQVRDLVGAVAERLVLGQTARAPGVGLSGFELHGGGLLGGDRRLSHGKLLSVMGRGRNAIVPGTARRRHHTPFPPGGEAPQ